METNKETAPDAPKDTPNGGSPSGFEGKQTFGTKAKRHCARFWWIWVIVFIIVVLVIVLPIVYVGVPHIGQDELDKTGIEVSAQEIRDPTPDSYHLVLRTTVTSDSSYHPVLSSFNVSLFLEDTKPDIKPFGYVTIPRVRSERVNQVDIDQDVQVTDMDQFSRYNAEVISNEEFRLALRGRPNVKLSGLPSFDTDYNKVVTMKGFNKLSGLAITSTEVLTEPAPDGASLLGTLVVPNPSVISIDMGNVTMDLSVGGTPIGTSLIPDMSLVPGNNSFDMRAYVNTTLVLGLVQSQYQNMVLPLDIVGNSSVNAAGERIPWLEAALTANTIRYDLNLTSALAGLSGGGGGA